METERLRSALLTSISHDLEDAARSRCWAPPGTLRDLGEQARPTARRPSCSATIIDESERLNRFIANLLDMTKLESGAVAPNASPHDVGEIVGTALRRAGKILAQHRVELELARPICRCSSSMPCCLSRCCSICSTMPRSMRRPATTVTDPEPGAGWAPLRLQVLDEGGGIPPGDLENLFDKFYRAQKTDQVPAGVGLALP